MATKADKNDDLEILSDIYHKDSAILDAPKKNVKETVKKYFSNEKNVEVWLVRAILFFGIFGVVFGAVHFGNQIYEPYLSKDDSRSDKAQTLTPDESVQDLLGLSQRDTDQDGLSDFDELNIYGTSPYLPDSDSDGYLDHEEIARGSDPLCTEGGNCFAFSDLDSTTNIDVARDILSGGASVEELKQLLIQAGATVQEVNQLSDQEIIQAYQATIGELSGNAVVAPSAPSVSSPTNFANLTPDELRDLLRNQAGISEEALSQISDEDLMKFLNEALEDAF